MSGPPFTEVVGRRTFLRVLGAATPAALASCSPLPPERLIPYVVPPENVVPGVASWYATVCRECPAGCGVHVRTREGRAVKVEGNPEHPISGGRLCIRGQASLQSLYDPDRVRAPQRRVTMHAGADQSRFEPTTWEAAQNRLVGVLRTLLDAGQGTRVAVVTSSLSGSLGRLVDTWADATGARHVVYEPLAYEPIREANRLTFGQDAIPHYDFARPDVLLSIGADFLETWLSPVDYAGAYSRMRRPASDGTGYFAHVEPRLSLTAAAADEWLSAQPGTEVFLVLAMVHAILRDERAIDVSPADGVLISELVRGHSPTRAAAITGVPAPQIEALARRFSQPDAGPGHSLAVGGGVAVSGTNATATQAAINLLNYVAGNVGSTVLFGPDSSFGRLDAYRDMLDLTEAMRAGDVDLLVVADANPAFSLPAAAGFEQALDAVPLVVSLSSRLDETAVRADLVLPTHTPLESWGDDEPRVGVRGLMQPVMRPLFDTRHLGDILLDLAHGLGGEVTASLPATTFEDYLRAAWGRLQEELAPGQPFDLFWADALRGGGRWRELPARPIRLAPDVAQIRFEAAELEGGDRPFVLMPYPSIRHYDGRGANNAWLQEIPDPVSKVAWHSWAELHTDTARQLGAEEGQLLTVESSHGRIDVPLVVNEQLRPGVVAVPLGQGHTAGGRYASGRNGNVMALLPATAEPLSGGLPFLSTRVTVTPRDVRRRVTTTQGSPRQFQPDVAQSVPAGAPAASQLADRPQASLYPEHTHPEHRWGMAIDLNACFGCNACVAACYAENNVPIVGSDQADRGRSLAWLQVERYDEPRETPRLRFVPMLCQQCDHAPCESVCPTYATYHTAEGLNAQVYNRCVGTRYCANNCPYQVRRFNWHEPEFPAPLHLQLNPDVTVRSKGVMEKCTFCVQRIQEGKGRAKDEQRPLRDGEITPACAQTCPAEAIIFGDLNDATSRVARLSHDPRGYRVLDILNTRPAITYLKKVVRAGTATGSPTFETR